MNRKLYKLPFKKNNIQEWTCPTCEKGTLKAKKDTFHYAETTLSKKGRQHEAWDPNWLEYVYSTLLVCTHPSCKDVVSSSGKGFVDFDVFYDSDGCPEQYWGEFFRPKNFQPHLKLFQIPCSVPDQVSDAINQSFDIFFTSPSSASNHIRIATEELLTHLKVKRYEIKKGKRMFINLHRRIESIPPKHKKLKEFFLAIKWLGNAGSHGGSEITIDDVMDAYEIMDVILHELFSNKSDEIKKIAKNINKKKGPHRKKR